MTSSIIVTCIVAYKGVALLNYMHKHVKLLGTDSEWRLLNTYELCGQAKYVKTLTL